MAKNRIIVMNGCKLTERELPDSNWKTIEVNPAGALRAGIYNIYSAKDAQQKDTVGQVIHTDDKYLYQKVSQNRFVKHDIGHFETIPTAGMTVSIKYVDGRASTELCNTQSKSRGR